MSDTIFNDTRRALRGRDDRADHVETETTVYAPKNSGDSIECIQVTYSRGPGEWSVRLVGVVRDVRKEVEVEVSSRSCLRQQMKANFYVTVKH